MPGSVPVCVRAAKAGGPVLAQEYSVHETNARNRRGPHGVGSCPANVRTLMGRTAEPIAGPPEPEVGRRPREATTPETPTMAFYVTVGSTDAGMRLGRTGESGSLSNAVRDEISLVFGLAV